MTLPLSTVPKPYYRGVWRSRYGLEADACVRCRCGRLLHRLASGWTCLSCRPLGRLIDDSIITGRLAKLDLLERAGNSPHTHTHTKKRERSGRRRRCSDSFLSVTPC